MIRLMGNGLRIQNVVQALCSDCLMKIYHISTRASFCAAGKHDILDFMIEHGFKDVFYLELEQMGDI